MALLLSCYQLSKSFSGKEVFKNVSFGIEEKERVALLGPNGVGKSTLMKILAGKLNRDSGDVVNKKGLRIAYLEQTPHFNPSDTIASALLNNHDMDGEDLARAYEWIAKLELSELPEDTRIAELSGGWQKRVALSRELSKNPDLLLLDEPTNHLDLMSIKWLEDFLADANLSCLLITHDRLFMQRVANKIIDLDPRFPGHLLSVQGTYDQYLETKALMIADQLSREQKLSNTLRREKEWLARGAKARQTKQKARQESAYELTSEVETLKSLNKSRTIGIEFESKEKNPKKIIWCENLGKKSFKNENEWLFRNLNVVLTPKTRLGIIGNNGVGKSTLIKTLLAQEKQDEGTSRSIDDIAVAYFEQTRDSLNMNKSVLKNLCPEGDYVDFRGQHLHIRSYLDRFRFFKDKADLPVKQLSGGEQARLRIAQLMLNQCQILVLDEPTNDLDVETLDSFAESLKDFDGAVILVTHDRFFMDQVCNQILAFSVFPEDKGELTLFADTMQWETWYEKKLALQNVRQKAPQESSSSNSGPKKKLSFKDKFDLENIEENILKAETALEETKKQIEDPGIASNPSKITELYAELQKRQEAVTKLYTRWNELEALVKET